MIACSHGNGIEMPALDMDAQWKPGNGQGTFG